MPNIYSVNSSTVASDQVQVVCSPPPGIKNARVLLLSAVVTDISGDTGVLYMRIIDGATTVYQANGFRSSDPHYACAMTHYLSAEKGGEITIRVAADTLSSANVTATYQVIEA